MCYLKIHVILYLLVTFARSQTKKFVSIRYKLNSTTTYRENNNTLHFEILSTSTKDTSTKF